MIQSNREFAPDAPRPEPARPVFPQGEEPGLEAQLRAALANPALPSAQVHRGLRLLERLERPVQLVVLGLAQSGKTAVIDMLLGCRAVGDLQSLAMVELAYGAEAQAIFEDETGTSTDALPGLLGDYEISAGIVSGRQVLPHPMLKSVGITEITLGGDVAQQLAILHHAVEYGDVILWCSPEFGAAEQALWTHVPERKRDSGFLVLTSADQLIMRGNLQQSVGRLAEVVEDGFLGLYPVAALQGLQAKAGASEGDRQLWRASGGQRLAEDLRRRVAQGRAATRDQAEALLWQLSLDASASDAQAQPDAKAQKTPAPADGPAHGPAHGPARKAAPAQPAPKAGQGTEAGQAALTQALAQLQEQAQAMLADAEGDPNSTAVLDQCLNAVQEMAKTLLAAPGEGDLLNAAREAAQDGEEMVMLLQLEQDEDAAVDAVTLLLQLKRELRDPPLPVAEEVAQ